MRLDDRVVLLTDNESETGRVVLRAFAAAGARVAGFCSAAKRAEIEADIQGAGGQGVLIEGQPSDAGDAERLVKEAVDRFGRIDVLVNGGSTHGRVVGTIFDITDEEFQSQLDADVKAVIVLSRTAIPIMAKQHSGSIINVSSVAAYGVKGRAMRSLSKAAMNSLTCAMALDHGPDGIRVNGLMLGPTLSQQWRNNPEQRQVLENEAALKRLHTSEDVANALLFLASDQAASLTGELLPLDAGRSLAQH